MSTTADLTAFRDLFNALKSEMGKAIVGYDELLTETLLAIFSGTLLARDKWAHQAASHPHCGVLQSHGVEDPILPFGAATELSQLLSDAGFDLQFIKFHGGHTIPTNALQALAIRLESLS